MRPKVSDGAFDAGTQWFETIAAVCRLVGVGEDLQEALCDGGADVTEAESSIQMGAATLKPGFKAMVGEAWRTARLAAELVKTMAPGQKQGLKLAARHRRA